MVVFSEASAVRLFPLYIPASAIQFPYLLDQSLHDLSGSSTSFSRQCEKGQEGFRESQTILVQGVHCPQSIVSISMQEEQDGFRRTERGQISNLVRPFDYVDEDRERGVHDDRSEGYYADRSEGHIADRSEGHIDDRSGGSC